MGFLLFGGHAGHEVHNPVALAEFNVILGNELYKVSFESNTNSSIKGERVSITVKITGDNLFLSVIEDGP